MCLADIGAEAVAFGVAAASTAFGSSRPWGSCECETRLLVAAEADFAPTVLLLRMHLFFGCCCVAGGELFVLAVRFFEGVLDEL